MTFENVVTLTQKAIAQAMGDTYMEQLGDLASLDSYKLADVGRDVTDASTVEKFTNALVSLIGKMEITNKEYKSRINSIMVDSFEWGGYVERVLLDLTQIIDDPMYQLVNGTSYATQEHTFYQPQANVKIFNEAKSFMAPISIQVDTLKEAFTSWDNLNSYLSAIRSQVRSTINYALDVYQRMLVCCGIAESCSASALNNAVHLITEAIAAGVLASGATVADARKSTEFKKWALKRMSDHRDQMHELSVAYNNGNVPTFASDTGMVMIAQFKNDLKYSVLADTYNPEELGIGEYDTIAAWQAVDDGSNPTFDFGTCTTVEIAADANNKLGIGTSAFEQDNVVAFMFDKRALGITLKKIKMTSNYTACADFYNEFTHVLVNYILDTNYGMVAFLLD